MNKELTTEKTSLPVGWEMKTLGEVCELYQPKTISKKELDNDGLYPVFGANGIIGRYNQYNHEHSQLLITCRGATCGSVNISEPKSWINGNAMVVNPIIDGLLLKYTEYFFKGAINISDIITGAAQPQITRQNLSPVKIPLPPLTQQKRIVATLDNAFTAIDIAKANAEQNLQNAKELFESYLQNVFENKGDNWEDKTLSEVTSKIGSGATPKGGKASYKEEGISLIRSMNVHDFQFKQKNLAFIDEEQANALSNVTIQEEDVLLNITGASIARCCIVPKEYLPARVNQHVSIIRAEKEIIDPVFLASLLTSKFFKDQILEIGEQGATRQAITKVQLENFIISFPKGIKEQKVVVESINTLKAETKRLEAIYTQKIADLEEMKKSILQKAFSGQLNAQI